MTDIYEGARVAPEDAAQTSATEDSSGYQPGEKYRDATIITPFNEQDYEGIEITVSIGPNEFYKKWKPQPIPVAGLIHYYTEHKIGAKDGLAVVFADMVPGQRKKKSVITCTSIGLDIDNGTKSAVVDAGLVKFGCLAIRTSTHSHGSRSSELPKDQILKLFPDADEVDTGMVREYLRTKRVEEYIIDTVEVVEQDHTDKGIVIRIKHTEWPKHRIIVPLLNPFVIANEGRLQSDAMAKWSKIPEALANKLGVPFDPSCTDPSRLFYTPRHAKNRPFEISLSGGPIFDFKDLNLDGGSSDPFETIGAEFRKGKKSKTREGQDLGKWSVHRARGFQIEDMIEEYAPDKIRGSATSGQTMECPFDAEHGDAGNPEDTGFYAVNGNGDDWFVAHCQHQSCRDRTNLDHLGTILKDWGIPERAQWDERFNAIELTKEELDFGKPAEAEILPTLAELKERIAELKDNATRDDWHPVLASIEEAHLNPTDNDTAHSALKEKIKADVKGGTYDEEVKEYRRVKKKRDREAKEQSPKGPDEKALAESDKLAAQLLKVFGSTFFIPSLGSDLHLISVGGRPWFARGKENKQLCTPFMLDGVVTYPDRNNDEAFRVRVLRADGSVFTVEFDAALLGQRSGSEVIGKLYAKGWRGGDEGQAFVLEYFKTQQLLGPIVYHDTGYREGVMVLATGEMIAPKSYKGPKVELHADSRLKGPFKAGTLDGWKAGAARVYGNPKAWQHQLGLSLGLVGPTIGYLGLSSVMVHLGGPSRNMKTTCKRFAGAHYAIPDEKKGGGYLVKSLGTAASQENTLKTGCCAVLGYDEFAKLPAKEQAEFAFTVEGGAGKRRATKTMGEQATIRWHALCVIVSAEQALGQILKAAETRFDPGMTVRMLQVAFRDQEKPFSEDEFKEVESAVLGNYGHSGPAFIRYLLEQDSDKLKDRLREIVDSLPGTSGDGSTLRRSAAQNVAVIQLAVELAIQAGLIPADYDPAPLAKKLWDDCLTSDTAPIDPAERGFKTLCRNLTHNKGVYVVDYGTLDAPRSREALAFHSAPLKGDAGFGQTLHYVFDTDNLGKLSDGADPMSLKRLAEDRGALVRPPGKRGVGSMTWPTFPGLGPGPFIVLKAAKVEGAVEEDDPGEDDSVIQS